MTQNEIAAMFHKVYSGQRNFMTPNIVKYGKRGRHLYELSSGLGISNLPIYGVTVIDVAGNRCHNLTSAFNSLTQAEAYIRNDFQQ
jgi:hypothetical protein